MSAAEEESPPLSLSMVRLAYEAVGELATDVTQSPAKSPGGLWRYWTCEWKFASELGISNRGRSRGDSESCSSTEFSGISGLFAGSWDVTCCGESFLFFVEDVVNASCLCSSGFA